ncbi:MAG: T9SS type A sorting domain-containing protein [Saprospiraceae bacterium]
MISPGAANNAYHRALVTPDGIEDRGWTSIGIPFGQNAWDGSLTFSRNGDMMARSDGFNGVHLYGFDRCSGEFTWYKRLAVFPLDQVISAFCAFSNDDRFLYVCYAGYPAGEFRSLIYQLDLHKSDPWSDRIRVGELKLNNCTFGSPVYGHLLNGPDGKIYVFANSNCDLLHIIHQPDSLGLACQVENDAIRTPALYRLNTPVFPNYRLGRAVGQYCDTLYRDPFAYTLKASPNPATDILNVTLQTPLQTGPEVRFSFYDLLGRPVCQTLQAIDRFSDVQTWAVQTSSLPTGIYVLHAEVPGVWQKAIKVMVHSP